MTLGVREFDIHPSIEAQSVYVLRNVERMTAMLI